MKRISWRPFLGLIALITMQPSLAAERVGNFALIDHEGTYHELRKYGSSKAVVIISIASRCEENINKLPKYRLLRTTWEEQGITLLAMNSAGEDDLSATRQMDELYKFDLPILLDDSQLVAESLGITKAGEVVVLCLLYTSDAADE